jgi:hypothetical protein
MSQNLGSLPPLSHNVTLRSPPLFPLTCDVIYGCTLKTHQCFYQGWIEFNCYTFITPQYMATLSCESHWIDKKNVKRREEFDYSTPTWLTSVDIAGAEKTPGSTADENNIVGRNLLIFNFFTELSLHQWYLQTWVR